MDFDSVHNRVRDVAREFASNRYDRQQRTHLVSDDFRQLADAGLTLTGIPVDRGGLWRSVRQSARPVCGLLRTLAGGDSSVALVSAMHPAVLSYWLTAPDELESDPQWRQQCSDIVKSVKDGRWWGTLTSEPGSGGDVSRTRTVAERGDAPLAYRLSGEKHFGSGSGIMSFMVTTAVPEGETDADWFFVDVRDVPWDGSRGLQLVAEWDGHGMAATQSHAFKLDRFPATRMAWTGNLPSVAQRTGGFIGCLFASVIVGIVDEAMRVADEKLRNKKLAPYEQVEWTRAHTQHWLIQQAHEGMLRAVEQLEDPRTDVLRGKTAIAELAEQLLTGLCRILGGSTFSRRSPFGFWFEDVRALGFLRPPWPLAFATLSTADE